MIFKLSGSACSINLTIELFFKVSDREKSSERSFLAVGVTNINGEMLREDILVRG